MVAKNNELCVQNHFAKARTLSAKNRKQVIESKTTTGFTMFATEIQD